VTRWIHGISKEMLRAAFCEYFGVSVEHSDILILLYERPDERVTTRKMQALLNSHRPPNRQAVYERVRVLREIMGTESLDSGGQLDDTGYALTEAGFDECRQALRVMATALLSHGPEINAPGQSEELIGPEAQALLTSPDAPSPPLRSRLLVGN